MLAVAVLYVVASTGALIAYAVDKSAARRGARRVPEATLHALALIGGWPGALIAQRLYHHKSRKASFQIGFWTTVAVNCAAAWWLLRPLLP